MFGAILVAQTVKNLPAMQEAKVRSLDREGYLEKGMAIQSIFACLGNPMEEESGGLQSMGLQSVRHH